MTACSPRHFIDAIACPDCIYLFISKAFSFLSLFFTFDLHHRLLMSKLEKVFEVVHGENEHECAILTDTPATCEAKHKL